MQFNEEQRFIVSFTLVMIGLTIFPVFIRERVPTTRDQLRAMNGGDWCECSEFPDKHV